MSPRMQPLEVLMKVVSRFLFVLMSILLLPGAALAGDAAAGEKKATIQ